MRVLACWACLVFVYACERVAPSDSSGPVSGSVIDERTRESAQVDCRIDDDCTLMPYAMTCCGECAPAPPFTAVPRTTIDALLLELETRCAEKPGPCDAPVCAVAPPGCEAYATCIGGRCTYVQSGACSGLLATLAP